MADKDAVIEAIARALRNSTRLSAIKGVYTRELDIEGTNANLEFPLIELQAISNGRLTDGIQFVGYVRDDAGNEIGEIYEWGKRLRVQIDIWTMSGGGHDAVDLSDELELALFRYDEGGYDDLLPDGNGGGIAEISLSIEEGNPANTRVPSGGTVFARRWRQDVMCTFTQRVSTYEEYGPLPYIENVYYPADGDYHADDPDYPDRVEADYPYDLV